MNQTNKISKSYILLFVFALAALFTGCKSSKTIVSNDGNVVQKSHNQVLDDALKAEVKYKTISGKTSLELVPANAKSGMKVNCYIKIIRDEAIQLSIRIPLVNSEAFRINMTPDSVYMIDRIGKKYVAERIKDLNKGDIQFNYYNVQALLTNSLFVPGKKSIGKKEYEDYNIKMSSGMFQVQTQDKAKTLYSFAIDANDRIASTLIYNENKNFTVQWSYMDFIKDASSNIYPTTMQAKVDIKKKRLNLNISYPELDINKEVKIDNQIPKKYQQSSISDILSSYIK
jgi:hypothetical protein